MSADTEWLLRKLNEAMARGEKHARAQGHSVPMVLERLGRVAFEGLDFGDVAGIATDAKRFGLEPLATVAAEALDHFTIAKGSHGKATGTN